MPITGMENFFLWSAARFCKACNVFLTTMMLAPGKLSTLISPEITKFLTPFHTLQPGIGDHRAGRCLMQKILK
jgi:hypothetical protein